MHIFLQLYEEVERINKEDEPYFKGSEEGIFQIYNMNQYTTDTFKIDTVF